MCAKIMRFARLTKLFAQELSSHCHKMLNNSPFGHETDGAQKACFHSLEIGLTQTPIWGVTHTYGRGVTQTDFEAVEGLEKKKRKK